MDKPPTLSPWRTAEAYQHSGYTPISKPMQQSNVLIRGRAYSRVGVQPDISSFHSNFATICYTSIHVSSLAHAASPRRLFPWQLEQRGFVTPCSSIWEYSYALFLRTEEGTGAGDGTRTRDNLLGRQTLYQTELLPHGSSTKIIRSCGRTVNPSGDE